MCAVSKDLKQEFKEMLKFGTKSVSLADRLKEEKLPLILWGIGDMGVDVKKYLDKNEISLAAAWVDNIDSGKYFDEIPVYSLDELKEKYKRFNVILGHSHYDLGEKIKQKENSIERVFYLIDHSYNQYTSTDSNYVREHIDDYFNVYMMLEDDISRQSMIAYLNCKMNDDIRYIMECVEKEQNFFNNDIFKIDSSEVYVDVGAYDGDTLRLFLEECGGQYKAVYALEPEDGNFSRLEKYVADNDLKNINLEKKGSWNKKTELTFSGGKQQESSIDDEGRKGSKIEVDTLDNILKDQEVTLIKINFYQGVYETLQGACDTLKRCAPKLAVSIGIDEKGIIRIPQLVKEKMPDYHIHLRFSTCIPARLVMYAKK